MYTTRDALLRILKSLFRHHPPAALALSCPSGCSACAALATANPIPDVPPTTTTRLFCKVMFHQLPVFGHLRENLAVADLDLPDDQRAVLDRIATEKSPS
jgi:hypothetical protein